MIVVCFIISLMAQFHFLAAKLHVLAAFVIFGFLIHFFVITALLMVMYWHGFTKKLVDICLHPVKKWGKHQTYQRYRTFADKKIDTFYAESLSLSGRPKILFQISILTLFQLFFYYIIPYFILLALDVTNVDALMVIGMHILIVMIISLFPLPGGIGGAEFSFSVVFSTFLTHNSEVVFAMVLWRLITYYLGMVLGMGALIVKPRMVQERQEFKHK